ncbi:MAG: GcrA family cell cycle regulator [Rhizobiaceae bacterium]
MNWTDERVEQLRKLWADGLSASQIAAQMGGVTRNAVIGKVHRLKLSSRGKSTSSQPRVKKVSHAAPSQPRQSSTVRPSSGRGGGGGGTTQSIGATALKTDYRTNAISAQVLEFVPALVAPESKKLMLVELSEHTCKWPIGDPMSVEFNFCGHEAGESGPYCQYHAKLAYQPASERRRIR